MLYRLFFIFSGLLLATSWAVQAQDPQFSQYYASPLYLNPALAGSTQNGRAAVNYRNQWPSMEANFQTYAASFDYMFQDVNSAIGAMILSDQASRAGYRSNSILLQYAYQLRLSRNWAVRTGIQPGFTLRDTNFDRYYFNSQWDSNTGGFSGAPPVDGQGAEFKFIFDMGIGTVLYSKDVWFGYAAHHLNRPNQSMVGGIEQLAMRHSFHGGYKIRINDGLHRSGYKEEYRERSITPTFQYKFQGDFDQLDVGTYLTWEPMVIGMWYRGLPFKPYQGLRNNEALVLLIGYTWNSMNIGYSYDYTISNLGAASGGAHEVSIAYLFTLRDPRRPPRDKMSIPCPKF